MALVAVLDKDGPDFLLEKLEVFRARANARH
jgi:hypothetical protein